MLCIPGPLQKLFLVFWLLKRGLEVWSVSGLLRDEFRFDDFGDSFIDRIATVLQFSFVEDYFLVPFQAQNSGLSLVATESEDDAVLGILVVFLFTSQSLPAERTRHRYGLQDESRWVQTGLLACLFKDFLLTFIMLNW